ncbi:hypothetical protein [Stutzerimonas kunmingensis]|uniref:hypothetical protein n=1 Tax=Stutzerimonas kunmingensis TaxID=1211807 RepID=UPI002FCB013F
MSWQPIETAPKDGREIWVGDRCSIRIAFWLDGAAYEHRGSIGGGWRDHAKAEARDLADLHFTPTHWQPLPDPPA